MSGVRRGRFKSRHLLGRFKSSGSKNAKVAAVLKNALQEAERRLDIELFFPSPWPSPLGRGDSFVQVVGSSFTCHSIQR